MNQAKVEVSTYQAESIGCFVQVLTHAPRTKSEQCVYMFLIEWLEQASASLKNFFENEAEYSEKNRLILRDLRKFFHLIVCINKTQKWLKNEELACGECLECRTNFNRSNIVEANFHEMLTYFEHHHSRQ